MFTFHIYFAGQEKAWQIDLPDDQLAIKFAMYCNSNRGDALWAHRDGERTINVNLGQIQRIEYYESDEGRRLVSAIRN